MRVESLRAEDVAAIVNRAGVLLMRLADADLRRLGAGLAAEDGEAEFAALVAGLYRQTPATRAGMIRRMGADAGRPLRISRPETRSG